MRKKSSLLMKSMCYTLCGAMVLSSPTVSALAAISETLYAGNTEIAAYITTTPRVMVGDTAIANISGAPDMVKSVSSWYRSASGDYADAEVISGETGISYTYTADDIGYYVFAVVDAMDSEGEHVKLATNMTPAVIQAAITETENWIQSTEYSYFEYDFVDGLDGKVQVRLVEDAIEIFRELGIKEITVPSTIDGYEVYRIADDAFDSIIYSTSDWSNGPYLSNIEISEGIVEIGKSTSINSDGTLIVPKSVQLIEKDAIQQVGYIIPSNGGDTSPILAAKRVVFLNPTVHFEDGGIPVSRLSGQYGSGPTVYVGAEGSSIHNVYDETIDNWINAGKTSPDGTYYKFEDSGVYNATQNAVDISAEDELQQKLDMNEIEWILSDDGNWYYDIIDGTDDVLVKPADVQMVASGTIVFPESLDGYEVKAAVVAPTTSNMHYDIPNGVIIDNATFDKSYVEVLSGNEGSTTQQFANDNNLIFHNKDNELETMEQYESAKDNYDISNSFTSEDGYWSYQFIDGYNGVVITNIKKFDTGICEVPTEIDGYKVSVFSPQSVKNVGKYTEVIIPDGLVGVLGDFAQRTGTAMGSPIYGSIATNVTIYDRDIDLSGIGSVNKSANVTTITGYAGSTADLVCVKRQDGTTNAGGILTKTTFIPLEEATPLESINLSGTHKVGETLTATIAPTDATVDYKWYRADSADATDWTEIAGATSDTYTLTEDDENMFIKVVATATGNYEGEVEAVSSSSIASNKTELSDVVIDGVLKVGETVSVVIEPEDATVDIKWSVSDSKDGVFTEVGTGADFELTEDYEGKYVKVEVVGNGDYVGTKEVVSDTTIQAENTIAQITKVTVSGISMVGEKLTANVYPSSVNADIKWLVSDTADGEYTEIGTGSTYTLTENELGKFVKAEATNVDDNTNVILSNATSAVSDKLSEDDNVDEYGRIIDSVERVEYVTEEMSESAFIGTEERDCLVYASQGQEFVVRIPKVLTMDGSSSSASIDFETELTANISGYDTITIEPDSTSIAMAESTGVKRDITCNLTVGQTQFSIANDTQEALEAGKVANHSASVDGISAGEWRGTFNWLIKARGQKTTDSEENVEY